MAADLVSSIASVTRALIDILSRRATTTIADRSAQAKLLSYVADLLDDLTAISKEFARDLKEVKKRDQLFRYRHDHFHDLTLRLLSVCAQINHVSRNLIEDSAIRLFLRDYLSKIESGPGFLTDFIEGYILRNEFYDKELSIRQLKIIRDYIRDPFNQVSTHSLPNERSTREMLETLASQQGFLTGLAAELRARSMLVENGGL